VEQELDSNKFTSVGLIEPSDHLKLLLRYQTYFSMGIDSINCVVPLVDRRKHNSDKEMVTLTSTKPAKIIFLESERCSNSFYSLKLA